MLVYGTLFSIMKLLSTVFRFFFFLVSNFHVLNFLSLGVICNDIFAILTLFWFNFFSYSIVCERRKGVLRRRGQFFVT